MNGGAKPTYSIILMRDDCGVSAFRLHSVWIKLFIFFLAVLLAACAAGGYGTIYYKKRYEVSADERRALQRALGEIKIKLENLANEELVGRFTGAGPGLGGGQNTVNSVMATTSGDNAASYSALPGATLPTQADLALLLSQIGPMRSAGAELNADLEARMEKHPVRVSNLKLAFEGEDRLRATYDLSNQQPGLTLTGRCSIAIITREGAVLDITPSARGVLTFQISRYRKMDILARIPPAVERGDIYGVRISAQANELPLYHKQFPVPDELRGPR